jgi:hypothetical protein
VSELVLPLTAEELHFLAAAHGLEAVPGMGPLPLDADDPSALRLMLGTAARSLRARGLGDFGPDGVFVPVRDVEPLFAPLADPDWLGTAARWTHSERASRAWCARGESATEVAALAPTDYELLALDRVAVRERIAEFLELHGDDDRESEPETPDRERMSALVAAPAWVAEASRLVPGSALAFQWVDPGDGGPVWVLSDGDPVRIARTGRAAVLARIAP